MNFSSMMELRREKTHQVNTYDGDLDKAFKVARGQTTVLADVQGHGYIAQFWLNFPGWFWRNWQPEAPVCPSLLKTLIIRIFWDDAEKPAVESPVGDFFGIGLCETANFTSKYFGMSSGGFYCSFPMGFTSSFRIEVENRDRDTDTEVYANILYQLTDDLPTEFGYFHAQFNTGHNSGPEPLHLAQATGRGHYAGCTLSIQAKAQNYLGYLEAPEYVYIDDDWNTARIIGTGLEDYFMGGWYFRDGCFHGPLHGLPVKDALNSMVAMYRVHEADVVRFQKRFRMEFNVPNKKEAKPFAHSSTAFLYVDTPEGSGRELPSVDELLCWYRVRDRDHQSIP